MAGKCKTTQKVRVTPNRYASSAGSHSRGQFAPAGRGKKFGGFTKTIRQDRRGRFC